MLETHTLHLRGSCHWLQWWSCCVRKNIRDILCKIRSSLWCFSWAFLNVFLSAVIWLFLQLKLIIDPLLPPCGPKLELCPPIQVNGKGTKTVITLKQYKIAKTCQCKIYRSKSCDSFKIWMKSVAKIMLAQWKVKQVWFLLIFHCIECEK